MRNASTAADQSYGTCWTAQHSASALRWRKCAPTRNRRPRSARPSRDIIVDGDDIFGDGVNVAAPPAGNRAAWRDMLIEPRS